jgi:hypothetical protein
MDAELLKFAGGFGFVGILAAVLQIKYMKSAEEREKAMAATAEADRKWRNEHGDRLVELLTTAVHSLNEQALTMQVVVATNKEISITNKEISDTNAKLVALVQKRQ